MEQISKILMQCHQFVQHNDKIIMQQDRYREWEFYFILSSVIYDSCSAGGGVVVIVPVPLPSYDPALLLETIGNWNSVCI